MKQLKLCVPAEGIQGQAEHAAPTDPSQRVAQGMVLVCYSLLFCSPASFHQHPACFSTSLAEGLPWLPQRVQVSGPSAGYV